MRGEFLDVNGARLYYYAAGSRGAGEPIVLLHGFPTSGHLWSDVVPALPAGHRVVVLDLLGYGRSDPPRAGHVDVNAHADRLVAVLDQLGIERACLVGHGVGGGVSQSVAIRFPHRVSRLCLVSSVAFDTWPTRRGRVARALAPLARRVPPAWVLATVRSELVRGYADPERGLRELDLFLKPFEGAAGRDALLTHLLAVTAPHTRTLSSRVGDITAPTSIVCGSDDPFLALSQARALASRIRGSTLEVIQGGRHFVPEEAAHSVAAEVRQLLLR